MPLPSQTARPVSGRTGWSFEGRRRLPLSPRALAIGGAVVAVVGIVVAVVAMNGGPSKANANTDSGTLATIGDGSLEVPQTGSDTPTSGRSAGSGITDPLASDASRALASGTPAGTPTGQPSGTPGSTPRSLDEALRANPTGGPIVGGAAGAVSGTVTGGTPASGNTPTQPVTPPGGQPVVDQPAKDLPPSLSTPGSRATRDAIDRAERLLATQETLAARELLWTAFARPDLSEQDRLSLRTRLQSINDDVVFGRKIHPGDLFTKAYKIQPGDALSAIPRKQGLQVDWRLIQRVNGIQNPNSIQPGQTLKLIQGPFHAIVHKGDYRLDLYHGKPETPGDWRYVRSFRVGLGESDSTPVGSFRVKNKTGNPSWVNPRDGRERYDRDDPRNPIGEHWVGLEGLGESSVHAGLGIHGTIEPATIGRQASMGCVRLGAEDVAMIYELLTPGASLVRVEP